MANLLRALPAAAEETEDRAAAAARPWPSIVTHVISLQKAGRTPIGDGYHGDYGLAALMPNTTGEAIYLYRELGKAPVIWWQPLAWQAAVERWLPEAQGDPVCVDNLIGFLRPLSQEDQARTGLPGVEKLVLANPGRVANRTFRLPAWLIEIRQAASGHRAAEHRRLARPRRGVPGRRDRPSANLQASSPEHDCPRRSSRIWGLRQRKTPGHGVTRPATA